MTIALAGLSFLLSLGLAAAMGFAIQRGATCMVAAVDELVARRRARRLAAMLAASLWVLAGLLVAKRAGALPTLPGGFQVSAWTLVGGALLGFGAFLGRACVFGAIARFGNGEWAYALVPTGFYAGCATVEPLFRAMAPARLAMSSAVLETGVAGTVAAAALVVVVAAASRRANPPSPNGATASSLRAAAVRAWSPEVATAVIGITFLLMLLLVGPWAYTEALADLARGMPRDTAARALLTVALFAGACLGGVSAGRFAHTRVTLPRALRCFASGALMGWGSLLIPGGNDGLILVGMPLLYPYAWAAMASMALAIAVAMVATRGAAVDGVAGAGEGTAPKS